MWRGARRAPDSRSVVEVRGIGDEQLLTHCRVHMGAHVVAIRIDRAVAQTVRELALERRSVAVVTEQRDEARALVRVLGRAELGLALQGLEHLQRDAHVERGVAFELW